MYKKMRKITAIMLIIMLTITHINIIGEVFATENGEYFDLNVYVDEKDGYLTVNGYTTYEHVEVTITNDYYGTNMHSRIEEKIPMEAILYALIYKPLQNEGKINANHLDQIMQFRIIANGVNSDGSGMSKQIANINFLSYPIVILNSFDRGLAMEVSKFIPYNINENKGVLLETELSSFIGRNMLPVKDTKIEIDVPSINNVKPKEVKVIAKSTKATNGNENGQNFDENNYTYDATSNKLTINVKNEPNAQGEIAWVPNSQDEFLVTFNYPEQALLQENVELEMNGNIFTTLYIYEEILRESNKRTFNLKEQVNNLVEFNIETQNQEISKGQLYANYVATNKIETEYNQTITANIGLASITDKIILEQNIDNFITKDNTKLPANETYNKKIIVDKNEVNKILGDNAEIYIYSGTTEIGKINKDTTANSEGKYVVDVSTNNSNTLRIETSKPQTEGNLNFTIVKALKGNLGYTKEQMASVNKLELNITGKAVNGATNFVEQVKTKEITLKEVTSQAEIEINSNNLSTVVVNENVKITAKLKTDTLDSNLYKNPTLKITLPNCIENINIKNIEVLFETEGSKLTLKPNENRILQNADGTKTILIELEGTQTEYTLGAVSKGLNVVITSDITVNKFTPNKQEQIKMLYTNKNVITNTTTEETNEVSVPINIVAPVGVITTTTLTNYKEGAQSITSISGEEKTATIPIISKEMNANLSMEVINNYNNAIDNITILGRTMFKDNKDILTGNNLGTTINMPLTSNITVPNIDANKVKVYYSENGEATKDLSIASNRWTLTPTNLENVKSYLIVLTDYSINTGEKINFSYNMKIPANLQHNESAYENYVVYFNNNLDTGTIQDKQASTKIGLTTGRGAELELVLTSNVKEEETLVTGKFIKYTVTAKNIGEEVAKSVEVRMDVPNCTNYIEFFEGEVGQYTSDRSKKHISYQLGEINPNQEISKSFWVVVDNLETEDICNEDTHYAEYNGRKYHKATITHPSEEYKTTTVAVATVSANDLAKEIKSNEIKNTVKKAYFNISTATTTNGIENLRQGDTFEYIISVGKYNLSDVLQNTILKTEIPEGLSYQETQIEKFNMETLEYEKTSDKVEYDEKTRILTINLGEIKDNDDRTIKIISKVEQLPEEEYSKKITSIVKISANGVEEETSNGVVDTIVRSAIKAIQTSTLPEGIKISSGEKFSYKIIIENVGADEATNIIVEDQLPEELQYISTQYTIGDKTQTISNIDEKNMTKLTLNIPRGEKAKININVSAKEIEKEKEILNSAKISSDTISTITTNKIKHTIEAFKHENVEDMGSITRKISGQVWKDENNDGIKDDVEEKVANVEVMLFDNQKGTLMVNGEGHVIRKQTGEDGTYTFTDVPQGRYTVIYLYDTANYSATTYRKENIDEAKNSDAIDSNITLDGITRIAGITEEIIITESNIYNIDLGLVSNPKFDLKLNKTISSITVQDSKGTKKYEYEDSKLAKKDLVAKNVNDTTIIVEYKIKVTNEGAISGFVKKIVDYMPTELKFNSELNKDWYLSENGILYNSSLANTIINPGETKEVTLTLTKKMTEDNLGIYHNEAEIYEAYNDLGIGDTDSIPGNKTSNEDDTSTADVVITVKTGEAILVIALSTTIILMISIGAYFIKKKVLR